MAKKFWENDPLAVDVLDAPNQNPVLPDPDPASVEPGTQPPVEDPSGPNWWDNDPILSKDASGELKVSFDHQKEEVKSEPSLADTLQLEGLEDPPEVDAKEGPPEFSKDEGVNKFAQAFRSGAGKKLFGKIDVTGKLAKSARDSAFEGDGDSEKAFSDSIAQIELEENTSVRDIEKRRSEFKSKFKELKKLKPIYDEGKNAAVAESASPFEGSGVDSFDVQSAAFGLNKLESKKDRAVYLAGLRKAWKDQGEKGVGETISDSSLIEIVPIFSSLDVASRNLKLQRAIESIQEFQKSGKLPDSEDTDIPGVDTPESKLARNKNLVTRFVLNREKAMARGQTVFAEVTEGVKALIPFALEFALTSGGASAFRAGAAKVASKVAPSLLKTAGSSVGRAAQAVIGAGVESVGRTALLQNRVIEGQTKRQLSSIQLGPKGDLVITKEGQSAGKAYLNAFGDVLIESFSEVSGQGIAKVFSKIPGAKKLLEKTTGGLKAAWMAKTGKGAQAFAKKLTSKAGFDGILEEIGEERLGGVLRAITGVEDFNLEGDQNTVLNRLAASVPGGRDALVELMTFSVPGLGRAGLSLGSAAKSGFVEAEFEKRKSRIQKRDLQSKKGLSQWVKDNPEVAAKLASKQTPSRGDLRAAGINGKFVSEERKALAARISQLDVKSVNEDVESIESLSGKELSKEKSKDEKDARIIQEDILQKEKEDQKKAEEEKPEPKKLLKKKEVVEEPKEAPKPKEKPKKKKEELSDLISKVKEKKLKKKVRVSEQALEDPSAKDGPLKTRVDINREAKLLGIKVKRGEAKRVAIDQIKEAREIRDEQAKPGALRPGVRVSFVPEGKRKEVIEKIVSIAVIEGKKMIALEGKRIAPESAVSRIDSEVIKEQEDFDLKKGRTKAEVQGIRNRSRDAGKLLGDFITDTESRVRDDNKQSSDKRLSAKSNRELQEELNSQLSSRGVGDLGPVGRSEALPSIIQEALNSKRDFDPPEMKTLDFKNVNPGDGITLFGKEWSVKEGSGGNMVLESKGQESMTVPIGKAFVDKGTEVSLSEKSIELKREKNKEDDPLFDEDLMADSDTEDQIGNREFEEIEKDKELSANRPIVENLSALSFNKKDIKNRAKKLKHKMKKADFEKIESLITLNTQFKIGDTFSVLGHEFRVTGRDIGKSGVEYSASSNEEDSILISWPESTGVLLDSGSYKAVPDAVVNEKDLFGGDVARLKAGKRTGQQGALFDNDVSKELESERKNKKIHEDAGGGGLFEIPKKDTKEKIAKRSSGFVGKSSIQKFQGSFGGKSNDLGEAEDLNTLLKSVPIVSSDRKSENKVNKINKAFEFHDGDLSKVSGLGELDTFPGTIEVNDEFDLFGHEWTAIRVVDKEFMVVETKDLSDAVILMDNIPIDKNSLVRKFKDSNRSKGLNVFGKPIESSTRAQLHKKVNGGDIKSAFPGSTVTKNDDGKSWSVSLPGGKSFEVLFSEGIPVDIPNIMRTYNISESEARRRASDGISGVMVPAGVSINLADGELVTFKQIAILLDPNKADVETVRHEALHLAREMGLFNTPSGARVWDALLFEYGAEDNIAEAEERIAEAREEWEGPKGLWARIRQWFAGLTSKLGFDFNPDLALTETFTERFWAQGAGQDVGDRGLRFQLDKDTPITSIRKEVVSELRRLRDVGELEGRDSESKEQWLNDANTTLAIDPTAGERLLNEISEVARPLSDRETALLQIYYRSAQNSFERVSKDLFAAQKSGDPARVAIAQTTANAQLLLLDRIEAASDSTGTEWSRAGTAKKISLAHDFSLSSLLRKERVSHGGKELSKKQYKEVSEMAKKIERLENRVKEEADKVDQLERDAKLTKKLNEAIIENKKTKSIKKRTPRDNKKKAALKKVKSAWEKLGNVFVDKPSQGKDSNLKFQIKEGSGEVDQVDGVIPEMYEAAKELAEAYVEDGMAASTFWSIAKVHLGKNAAKAEASFKKAWFDVASKKGVDTVDIDETDSKAVTREAEGILRHLVEAGMRDREQIIDAVHESLKESIPGITRRYTIEALSHYGQFSPLSKEEVDQVIRDLKGQMLELSKLSDMEHGSAPKATGKERPTPSDEVRRLKQLVNEAKKRGGFEATDQATALKSALDAAKTSTRNRISDLTLEINSKERIVRNRTELKPDAELAALRAERDKLSELHRAIFPARKATQAQKVAAADKALDRAITDLSKRLKEGDIAPRTQTKISTPKLESKRSKLKAMGLQLKALRAAANPKMTPEERSRRLYEANLERRISDYEERIEEKDFAPRKKEVKELSDSTLKLKRRLEETKSRFLKRLADNTLANMSLREKAGDIAQQTAHLSHAVMTAFDLSAVFRQGGVVSVAHPELAKTAAIEMMKALVSKQANFNIAERMKNDKRWQFSITAGLSITEEGGPISKQEEAFRGRWAELVPGVAASGRAYTTFLNKIRFDLFNLMVENVGRDGRVTLDEAKVLAEFINTATGRGNIKSSSKIVNAVFFAPRWVLSRFQYPLMLVKLPFKKTSWRVKKAIAKEYGRTISGAATFIGLLMAMGYLAADDDDEIPTLELDPRSSDFLKIKIGETRIDPLFGLQQAIVFSARLAKGETKSTTGKIRSLTGDKGPFAQTRLTVIGKFLRTKLGPIPGAAATVFDDMTDVVGQKQTAASLVGGLFAPLAAREVATSMEHRGMTKGAAISLLALLGMGGGTYGPRTRYLAATPEERKEIFRKDLKNAKRDDKPLPYSDRMDDSMLKALDDAKIAHTARSVKTITNVKPKLENYKRWKDQAEEKHQAAVDRWEKRKEAAILDTQGLSLGEARGLLIKEWKARQKKLSVLRIRSKRGKITPFGRRWLKLSAFFEDK